MISLLNDGYLKNILYFVLVYVFDMMNIEKYMDLLQPAIVYLRSIQVSICTIKLLTDLATSDCVKSSINRIRIE